MKWLLVILSIVNLGNLVEMGLSGTHVIGLMPGVEITTSPNTLVCGKWIGTYGNKTITATPYCRTTKPDGSTFFRYRARFDEWYPVSSFVMPDTSNWNISFQVTN